MYYLAPLIIAEFTKLENKRKKEASMTNNTLELGTIPKGTLVKINGMPFILHEGVKVNSSQHYIDQVIKEDQSDLVSFGVDVGCNASGTPTRDVIEKLQVLGVFANSNLCVQDSQLREDIEAKVSQLIEQL